VYQNSCARRTSDANAAPATSYGPPRATTWAKTPSCAPEPSSPDANEETACRTICHVVSNGQLSVRILTATALDGPSITSPLPLPTATLPLPSSSPPLSMSPLPVRSASLSPSSPSLLSSQSTMPSSPMPSPLPAPPMSPLPSCSPLPPPRRRHGGGGGGEETYGSRNVKLSTKLKLPPLATCTPSTKSDQPPLP